MRTIDADKAIEVANDLYEKYNFAMACADTQREINHIFKRQELFKAVKAVIEHCPTINPVKHGKWLSCSDRPDRLICSVCNRGFDMWFYEPEILPHCPNCGARMNGDKE